MDILKTYFARIKVLIQQYKLWPFIISIILIACVGKKAAELLCTVLGYEEGGFLYGIYNTVFFAIQPAIWSLLLFVSIRETKYYLVTGRSFKSDHSKYGRTYKKLCDYFKDAEPYKMDTDRFKVENWYDTDGFIFGKTDDGRLIKISSDSEANIAVFGPPGSGKTSGIAIINALQFEGAVLAIDIKGDIYNCCKDKRNIIRFCPDSPNAITESAHFNPLAGINLMSDTDKKLFIKNMSVTLVPTEKGGEYFSETAQIIFQGIMYLMLSSNKDCTFPEFVHAVLRNDVFTWVEAALSKNNKCSEARELLGSLYGNNEKNIAGAYQTLCKALSNYSLKIMDALLSPATSNRCISTEMLESGYDIYLQISQEHLNAYAPLLTLIVQSFSTAFTKRPDISTGVKTRPILMLLDEFPQLTFDFELINQDFSTLRSKNIVICIIQQSIAQLIYRYSRDGARIILENCRYQAILGANDYESSKYYSSMFGKKKTLKVSNSASSSRSSTTSGYNVQEAEEYIFPYEEFGVLPQKEKMILYADGKYIKGNRLNCYKDRMKIK